MSASDRLKALAEEKTEAFARMENMKLKVMESEKIAQALKEEAEKAAAQAQAAIDQLHKQLEAADDDNDDDDDDDDLPPASMPAPIRPSTPPSLSAENDEPSDDDE